MRTIPLMLVAVSILAALVPAFAPAASATTIGDRVTGDPTCANAPSSGTRFTGVYDNTNGMLLEIGGESWCSRNTTLSQGTGIFVIFYSSRTGPTDAWWEGTTGGCSMGFQTPRGVITEPCPAGMAPPDPGWGKTVGHVDL